MKKMRSKHEIVMNLYWPVYKRIESEVLSLAEAVHFSDDQINVYSAHIADLIIRCAIEIEAISKDLYLRLGGEPNPLDEKDRPRDLYFDTDCLRLINEIWHLDKKLIGITGEPFYFQKKENKELYPLKKSERRGDKGSRWKRAYQALKHDRYNALNCGTIGNLLNALGSLFILNVYYKDEVQSLGNAGISTVDFDNSCGSNIFRTDLFIATQLEWNNNADDSCIIVQPGDNLDSAIHIIKLTDKAFKEDYIAWCVEERWTKIYYNSSNEINDLLKMQSIETDGKSYKEICIELGGETLWEKIKSHYREDRLFFPALEVVLNKDNHIYPHIGKLPDTVIDTKFKASRGIEAIYHRSHAIK